MVRIVSCGHVGDREISVKIYETAAELLEAAFETPAQELYSLHQDLCFQQHEVASGVVDMAFRVVEARETLKKRHDCYQKETAEKDLELGRVMKREATNSDFWEKIYQQEQKKQKS